MKPKTTTPITLVCLAFALLGFLCANSQTVQAQQVQVTAADPPSAAQGTINLNVKVKGKGFKNGANAKFFVTGTTDTGGVTVNSTTFVNSAELTANITVADTATISNFDILVTNSDGRGGKGTELFAVTPKVNASFRDAVTTDLDGNVILDLDGNFIFGSDRIRSDSATPSIVAAPYIDGVDCVGVQILGTSLFLRTDKLVNDVPCALRAINLDFSDAISRTPDGSGTNPDGSVNDCLVNDAFGQLGQLNICGSNAVPDVRFQATQLFSNTALTNGVNVKLPFSLNADFKNTGFLLEFEQPLTVTGDANVRVLTAESNQVAVLSKGGLRRGIVIGRFRMPFKLTVSKLP
jgi:hypothetical protein